MHIPPHCLLNFHFFSLNCMFFFSKTFFLLYTILHLTFGDVLFLTKHFSSFKFAHQCRLLQLNCLVLILYFYIHFLSLRCYFLYLKHYWDLYITDTALKVSRSLKCFTTFISHGVENYFPRLWGTCISDAIFLFNIAVS